MVGHSPKILTSKDKTTTLQHMPVKTPMPSPISQKFPLCCLSNSSIVSLTDDGLFSSFQERPLNASSFCVSPPGDLWCDVLGFVPEGTSQAPKHSDLLRCKPFVIVDLPTSLYTC